MRIPVGSVGVIAVRFLCCAGVGASMFGCYSHQDRWGRDPKKLAEKRDAENRVEGTEVELARSALQNPPAEEDLNDLSPVPVLFVNGAPLTVDDVLKWARPNLDQMMAELPPDQYPTRMVRYLRDEIRRRAEGLLLSQRAMRELNEQQQKRLGSFVDQRIRETVTREHAGRQSRYEEALLQKGISPLEDRERIRQEMLVATYLQRMVRGKVSEPTRRELVRVYEQFMQDARDQRRCHMWLIDIPYGDRDAVGARVRNPVSRDAAWEQARLAASELRSGAVFSDVAKRYSQGINAASGGDWGMVGRDGVRERWRPAIDRLFTLPEGHTCDPIDTGEGFFIVHCSQIDEPETGSFEEVQTRLVEVYRARQYEMLSKELISKLFAEADVRPANPGRFLRAVVEAAPQPAFARSR